MVIDSSELVVIGKITSIYGVQGWVKIHSYTRPIESLLNYRNCYLDHHGTIESIVFGAAKHHGKGLISSINGVMDREQAKDYCQCNILVPVMELPEISEDEFYWRQLEGLEVYATGADDQERLLGMVDHLMETGANDVLVVQNQQDHRERLIPWLPKQVIKEVDTNAGLIRVDWDPEF